MKPQNPFLPADILLPKVNHMKLWSVVACDQYTSEPEYWERVDTQVGEAPSTLRMIFPEVYLGNADSEARIAKINETMQAYLDQELFQTWPDSFLYMRRTLADRKIRQGLIGKIDLEHYDYTANSQSLVRPTEGTVESRLPPRIKVREQAPLELPHIMLLIDDPENRVIAPLAAQTGEMDAVYDTALMENGGAAKGWILNDTQKQAVLAELDALPPAAAPGKAPLLYAVGDGNHSLATAKACYEKLKQTLPKEEWVVHPARYALVELVNLHDPAMEFEPIHRVLFGVDPAHVLSEMESYYQIGGEVGQKITFITAEGQQTLTISNPSSQLAVGSLQNFIDDYLNRHNGEVDYIHGDDVTVSLAQGENCIGFLLPAMDKADLFQAVLLDGALPRKTFSMGHAHDKRYYLECKKIR